MGMGAELRLKVGVENEAHYFLQQFIRPGLNTKWAFPPILFRDVDTPGRAPLIPLVSHCVDDGSNFLPGHAICGFLSCSFSHSSMVPVNLPIGLLQWDRFPSLPEESVPLVCSTPVYFPSLLN